MINFVSLLAAFANGVPTASSPVSNFPTFIQYSAASYCNQIWQTGSFNCGIRCSGALSSTQIVSTINSSDSAAASYVGYNDNLQTIVIAFRGTDNLEGALQDLEFAQTDSDWQSRYPLNIASPANAPIPENLKVHAGFEEVYGSIRDDVLIATNQLAQNKPNYQIVFTGHSLGGAIASFAAVDFQNVFGMQDRISLYTYGQPRVGNDAWANYVDQVPFVDRIYRVARRGDPVVHLPLNAMGYYHFKQQWELNDDGSTTACAVKANSGESPSCLNDLFSLNAARHSDYYGWLSAKC
ncbi:hypothetical protein HK103_002398 [Boothiomyces macroporosus]|uniref:Fungal lipase-type domain-containing protein n=1 Tax=Boothiomyces macroporosus TaxID=261099 RepID=A0AAD5Y4F0_9FUNG|nr:hypothetical protein HK103_002398 [Boothiomyces macroporosus]